MGSCQSARSANKQSKAGRLKPQSSAAGIPWSEVEEDMSNKHEHESDNEQERVIVEHHKEFAVLSVKGSNGLKQAMLKKKTNKASGSTRWLLKQDSRTIIKFRSPEDAKTCVRSFGMQLPGFAEQAKT